MKAITLHQPWASLMAEGIKTIETRGRRSPWHTAIGQRVAIHAGKVEGRVIREAVAPLNAAGWQENPACRTDAGGLRPLPLGAILATGILVDVLPMVAAGSIEDGARIPRVVIDDDCGHFLFREMVTDDNENIDDQAEYGDFRPGRVALIFEDIVKLEEPIPARGYQGLWSFDDHHHLGPMLMTPERRAVVDRA